VSYFTIDNGYLEKSQPRRRYYLEKFGRGGGITSSPVHGARERDYRDEK
jgi:hypothetical protein